jgi:hypothetical protein
VFFREGVASHVHPERACTALRAQHHREAFFPLDADFALRVTLQQPKLLCSSQLGETCPPPPDAVGGVIWEASRENAPTYSSARGLPYLIARSSGR